MLEGKDIVFHGKQLPEIVLGRPAEDLSQKLAPLKRRKGVWADISGPQPKTQAPLMAGYRANLYAHNAFGFEFATRSIDGFHHLFARYVPPEISLTIA